MVLLVKMELWITLSSLTSVTVKLNLKLFCSGVETSLYQLQSTSLAMNRGAFIIVLILMDVYTGRMMAWIARTIKSEHEMSIVSTNDG